MSTHTPPVPYPHLLAWLSGQAPDTPAIAGELATMAQRGHFARLVTTLRLHGELAAFRAALLVVFPHLDPAAPQFPAPQGTLGVLAGGKLTDVATACLAEIALGQPEPAYDQANFATSPTGLLYRGVPVFVTVDGTRTRLFAAANGTLYITGAGHPLKGWLRRQDADVTLQAVHSVAPDTVASGYNALSSADTLTWPCSYGKFGTPKEVIDTVVRSEAFDAIAWTAPYCTVGWVASLMPTLSTKGVLQLPGGKSLTIGQNVHSSTIVGSAWIVDMANVDCRPGAFPAAWTNKVKAVLCPRAAGNGTLTTIRLFCDRLKVKYSGDDAQNVSEQELRERIAYLITTFPDDKEKLRKLPGVMKWYSDLFQ